MNVNRGATAAVSRAYEHHTGHPESSAKAASGSRGSEANRTSSMKSRSSASYAGINATKDMRLQDLAMISLSPILRSIHHWWLQRAERHYLICADVEEQRAREAQMNVAYYQKRAALARSARN